ncbi:MAG TPA: hypothetical protein ENJ12_10680, partial [Thiolapillus brandeum]|nr:hypothetical protein [Thiolapillus brandeum]
MKLPTRLSGLLMILLMSVNSMLFAAYGAVTDLPKIQLNKGGSIKAIVELSDGSLVIGGRFTQINGKEQTGLARIKADGTLDEDWNAGIRGGNLPGVDALALAGDNLYLGGSFYEVGGESRRGIARIDIATAKVDTSWNPFQDGDDYSTSIFSLVLTANGEQLFLGGYFNRLGGIDISAVAKVSTLTGDVDADWNPGLKQYDRVYTLLLSGDDLYFGGQLREVAGIARQGIARVSAAGTGALDESWDPKIDGNWVHSLALSKAGDKLYMGGDFYSIDGTTRYGLARVNTSDAALDSWDPAPRNASLGQGDIRTLFLDDDGLYVGGSFSTIGGQDRNGIALLSTTDATAGAWNPDAGHSSDSRYVYVYSLLLSADGSKIHVGGTFFSMGGMDAMAFASVDKSSGNPVPGLIDLLIGNPGEINAIATVGDNLYFAGDFVRVNGKPLHYLGKWDIANQKLVDWDAGFDDRVLTIAADANSVYAGGYFNRVGGLERDHLAKLNASDASVEATWDPGADSTVS